MARTTGHAGVRPIVVVEVEYRHRLRHGAAACGLEGHPVGQAPRLIRRAFCPNVNRPRMELANVSAMMMDDPALIYTRAYYADAYEATLVAARLALPAVFEALGWPQYLVDVGCGSGAWCDAAVALGVPDVTGIDGWWAQPEHPTRWRFMAMDLRCPAIPPDVQGFDLALCLEVGEHLPEACAAGLLRFCCALARHVAWSAAPPGQESLGHVNMQPRDWWATRFAAQGYEERSISLPDDERIPFWYRRNLIGFLNPQQ